jgi:hypothetical protein
VRQRLVLIGVSLVSQALGWLYGHVFIVIYMVWDPAWQPRSDDELSMLMASGLLIMFGWLFVVLPLVTFVSASSRLFAPLLYVPVGALGATLFFKVTVGWWITVSIPGPYYLQAIVVGATAALFHSVGLRFLAPTAAQRETPGAKRAEI